MDEQKNTPQGSPTGREDMEELFRLLDRLEQRERAERAAAQAKPDNVAAEESFRSSPQARAVDRLPEDVPDMDEFDLIDPYEVAMQEEEEEASFVPLIPLEQESDGDEDAELPPIPPRRNPFAVMWQGFRANLPAKGDDPGTLVRKLAFLLALVVLIVSLGYILVDVCVVPMQNAQLYNELEEIYQPENSEVVTEGDYPNGMLASFKELYDRNDEVRGWISYHASGNKDFLNIEYPVMFSGDNDKYLTIDFNGKKNKNGALFFDMNNQLDSADAENRSLIIYGHNMASGQMFAGLNKFIGSVSNARAAAELTMSTLYEKSTYRVFAVLITDEDETANWYFNTRRTQFAGAADFLGFVEQLRNRSLFDYPVEVDADDELLVLSTCTAKSTAKIKDGRLVVVARKVRPGEGTVDTAQIQRNNDVIMPRSWYINQGLVLHDYYGGDHSGITTTTTKKTTTTTGSGLFGTTTGTGTEGSTTTGTGSDTTGTDGSQPAGNTTSGNGGSGSTGTTAGTAPVGNTTAATIPSQSATAGGDGTTATTGAATETTGSGEATTAPSQSDTTAATESTATTEATQATETTPSTEPAGETTQPESAPTESAGE